MQLMPPDHYLELFRLENEERIRAAERRRRAPTPTSGSLRRLAGTLLVRLGVLVGGPSLHRPPELVPAHRGGTAR